MSNNCYTLFIGIFSFSRFKVTIEEEALIDDTFCACISIKGSQVEKALGMMKNYSMLSLHP
ncbi:MAG: hypothetical protein GY908_00855 [Flavobacteriales bacterium]|nr:hypothetical protein [Flavobacteriales bacterium]